jgi:hypothetical protein
MWLKPFEKKKKKPRAANGSKLCWANYLPQRIQGSKLINRVTNIVGKTFWINDRTTDEVPMNDCKKLKCLDSTSRDVKPRIKEIGNSQNIVRPLYKRDNYRVSIGEQKIDVQCFKKEYIIFQLTKRQQKQPSL